MNILQMIADTIEKRAIAKAWEGRDFSEWDNKGEWPWGVRDDHKDEYREEVVREIFRGEA